MLDRRNFVKTCSGMGLAGTLFPGMLWAQAQAQGAKKITKEMIENAAAIADVPISEEYKEMMLESLNEHAKGYEEIYKLRIPNSVDPALIFDPVLPGMKFETERKPARISKATNAATASAPKNLDDLAFASARELGGLVRTKQVSSLALTAMYLGRLKKYDPTLKIVVTLTEEGAGTRIRDRADLRQVPRPQRMRVAWPSASGRKRSARFRLPRRAAGARDCDHRSAWCQERARWHFPGAWTSWGRFAGPLKIARSFWTRFTGATAKIERCSPRRSIVTQI